MNERASDMTIRTYLEDAVRLAPQTPAQRFFAEGVWVTRTYLQLQQRVAYGTAMVRHLGLNSDANPVGLMLDNGPEWQEIYLALACSGVPVVPLDPKLRPLELAYILRDSDAVAVFAGARLDNVLREVVREGLALRLCVWVGESSSATEESVVALDGLDCYRYETLHKEMSSTIDAKQAWLDAPRPSEATVASLIYTSGTTGQPKGAMLTHGNFTANVADTCERVGFKATDNFLNALPLFHAFSFTANFILPLGVKACCSFVRSMRTVSEDMLILQPTILLAVPLMAEKLYARITERLKKNRVARVLLGMGLKALVSRKVIAALGGRLRLMGIGGAPTPLALIQGLQKVGIPVLEGYGLTECSPGVAYPNLKGYVPGTVGRVLSSMQAKLVDANAAGVGELCVKGPNVMKGYYKNPVATAEVFDQEGFFHTGDLVCFDAKQNITICGRKKALIVNREGKNIYPEEVEQIIECCPFIKDILVLGYTTNGEGGERVGVIAVPNLEILAGVHPKVAASDVAVEAFLREQIMAVCHGRIADYKIPRKIVIQHDPLERTSTMKVRRAIYAGTLDEFTRSSLMGTTGVADKSC